MSQNRFSLAGHTALVTGATGDFGAHFARLLSSAGAAVACAGRRKDRLDEVVQLVQAGGGKAFAVAMDVTEASSVVDAFDAIEATLGPVDVLVNNAGLSDVAPFPDMTAEQWQRVIDTNLGGPWQVSREMSKRLIAHGQAGRIVNIASITGVLAKGMFSNYGTSKAALIHLTKQMAMDLLPHRIQVNALAPGYFPTDMTNWFFETDMGKAEIANLPAQRLGRLDELDGPLLLLASDASSYINGTVIAIDYGHSVRLS
jgi:NAD(P)-dependent dehydrogenase (short-subunit alcohol dehydrogenase family)